MQVDSLKFEEQFPRDPGWEENYFLYCEFNHLEDEGAHVDSFFHGCTFTECDLYWALFNLAVFVQVKFKGCKFRGCSFADCRFIECEFEDCEFTLDNLGRGCSFEGTRWYACSRNNTLGLNEEFGHAL